MNNDGYKAKGGTHDGWFCRGCRAFHNPARKIFMRNGVQYCELSLYHMALRGE